MAAGASCMSKLLGFSLLPSQACLRLCVHWAWFTDKQDPQGKILSCGELGQWQSWGGDGSRGCSLILQFTVLAQSIGAEAKGAAGNRHLGLGLGACSAHACARVWLHENLRVVCVPTTWITLPSHPLSIFVWITLRKILVLSNNSLDSSKGFVWLILKQSALDRLELRLWVDLYPLTPYSLSFPSGSGGSSPLSSLSWLLKALIFSLPLPPR